MTTKRGEQLVAQGERTRAHLLVVASAAIAARSDVSLNEIARTAGVGIGTLYRHFPSREDLVLAVYGEEVRQLADSAAIYLSANEPLDALRAWLDRFAQYAMTKPGLVDALGAGASHGRFASDAYGPVTEAIALLLRANRTTATIQDNVTPDDVLLAVAGLYQLDPASDWRPRADRILHFAIAGLRRQD